MADIFISYAHKDKRKAQYIAGELHMLGFDYWMDVRNLNAGSLWSAEISEAILHSKKFLLLASSTSLVSSDVWREIQLAYDNQKKIYILRLEDVQIPTKSKYLLAGIQWVDYWDPEWKPRLVKALGMRAKISPSRALSVNNSSRSENTARIPTGNRKKVHNIEQILATASGLEKLFSTGKACYPDQCDIALSQLDELRDGIGIHWINVSSEYQLLVPRVYLLGQIERIKESISEFRSSCPPGAADKHLEIHKHINDLLESLKHQ